MLVECKEAFAKLFRDMEELLAVPAQMLCNFFGIFRKPNVGERPITLTVALNSLYCNVRNVFTVQWDKDHAGFTDDVVQGSSALMAAIKRNIIHEACVALGISSAQILWDFEKNYLTPCRLEYVPWGR